MLEKKIKYNNQYWLVQLVEDENVAKVQKYNEDGNIIRNFKWECSINGKDLIEKCKNAVLRANGIYSKADDIKRLASWDGDMDEELNPKTFKEYIEDIQLD